MIISLFEINNPKRFRFRTKMLRKTIKIQRNPYAGRMAANLAKKNNPGLAALKERFRKKYLELKKREQNIYGRRGLALARQH